MKLETAMEVAQQLVNDVLPGMSMFVRNYKLSSLATVGYMPGKLIKKTS